MSRMIGRIFLMIAGLTMSAQTVAQTYPARPVRVIVGFTPGNASDIIARMVTKQMTASLGQSFVIDNRAGAAGTIATEQVVRANPDGYTLLVSTIALPLTAALYPKLNYDTAKDLTSITVMMEAPLVLAAYPGFPPKTVFEMINYAKANPGKVSYGSSGIGTSTHIAMEKLKLDAGIDLQHIPYKGTGGGLYTDILSGQVQLMLNNIIAFMPYYSTNKLRAMAVSSIKRHPLLTEVPTLSEAGVKDFEIVTWNGFAAPKGTPREVVTKLHAEIVKALAAPDVRKWLLDSGAVIVGNTPEAADRQLKTQIERFTAVVKAANIKPE